MIQEIFLGNRENIGSPTIPNDDANYSAIIRADEEGLTVIPFSVSDIFRTRTDASLADAQRYDLKIDMLFYNKVNANGAVMSSIVYLGDPVSSHERGEIKFIPKKQYYNSVTEAGMDLQRETNFHYFNYLRDSGENYPCFIGIKNEKFNLDGMPANVMSGNTPTLDGWFTIVSAAVLTNTVDNNPMILEAGALVKRGDRDVEFAVVDYPEFSNDEDWHTLGIYDNRFNTAFYVDDGFVDRTFTWDPPFIRQDFMVIPRYGNVYEKTLYDYIYDESLDNMHGDLRRKYRMIHYYAKKKDFKRAQAYLQSKNLTIITENWI